jgi:hypothetical protein
MKLHPKIKMAAQSHHTYGTLAVAGGLAKCWLWLGERWPLPPQSVLWHARGLRAADLVFTVGVIVLAWRLRHAQTDTTENRKDQGDV